LEPYLVPGVTDENSSIEEISSAYNDSTLNRIEKKNPQPSDRGQLFVVSFSGGELEGEQFTSFIGFTPIKYKPSTKTPASHQQYEQALELLSLPEKNMEKFYQYLVGTYVNPGKTAEPVDITIDVVTGDGSIIQSWFYNKCELVEYTPYRDEALNVLKLSGIFGAEYSDRTVFACRGHSVDFSQRDTVLTDLDGSLSRDLIPSDEERLKKFAVHFSGGEIPFSGTSLSFSHFAPIIDGKNPDPQIGNLVFSSPQFLLSSLPNKDMESYYQWIERYINKGKQPELFDVTIDMITGDNSILQTWHYTKCKITNYVTYFEDFLIYAKFAGGFSPEFRDRAIFECNGRFIDASVRQIEEPDNIQTSDFVPNELNRAQNIVVHFEGTEISPAKSVHTFTKFAPVLDGKPQKIVPTYPFADINIGKFTSPMFILESLPSKDKEWLNEFTTKYINIGKVPELFKVRVDVVSGDGSIIQSWNYQKCQIKDYKQFFDDSRLFLKFHGKFQPEIRERTTFACGGFSFDGTTKQLEEPLTDSLSYVDHTPKYEDRAAKYAVHFSGGELTEPVTSFTYSKFEPTFPPPGGPAKHSEWIAKFTIEGLSTKDRQQVLFAVSTYLNPEKPPEPFDVTIDVLTGDDKILQQWFYKKCEFVDANLFVDKYIITYKIHGGEDKEYHDFFDFECRGLQLDFSVKDPNYNILDTEQYLKDPHNRLTAVIFHMQNGELETTWTSYEMPMFEATSPSKFSVTGLPNKNFFPLMEFFSRYMNPGKSPEKFDMIIDLVAGDGERITSLLYNNCDFSGGYMYYDDNIAGLKIRPQIAPELKAKGDATCAAASVNQVFAQLYSIPPNTFSELSPRQQIENGVIRADAVCREGLQKMIVPFEETPRCVFPEKVSKFEERLGWIAVTELDDYEYITNPIPKPEDSAEGIVVRFSGQDFEEEITVDTFVKYVPTASVDSGEPGYAFGSRPLFFIDGLPSKDKSKLYEIVSKSINPGKKPKNIEISIDILYGDGTGFMSLKHEKCQIERYHIYLDQNLFSYKYHGKWQTEIKDRLTMSCVQIGGGPVPI